ncbi:MAG: hypothetical protein M3O46_09915, partial [Myxococcota bacterium]|nr:hypothetical protein [Myxococcota bacterium]
MNCDDDEALAAYHDVSGHYGDFSMMRKREDGAGGWRRRGGREEAWAAHRSRPTRSETVEKRSSDG